jgi:hypothetical protein
MRFTTTSCTILAALAGSVFAEAADPGFDVITKPSKDENVTSGSTYTIAWSLQEHTQTGPVDIILLGGPNNVSLAAIETIASKLSTFSDSRA